MFKKISIALLVVTILAAGAVGAVYASSDKLGDVDIPFAGHRGPHGGGDHPGGRTPEGLAEALGMTVEELQAELEAGKTIAEIAEEQGIDLGAFALEQAAERLAQAVEDGKLTQEEADEKLAEIQEAIESGDFKGLPGPGGRGKRDFQKGPHAPGDDA